MMGFGQWTPEHLSTSPLQFSNPNGLAAVKHPIQCVEQDLFEGEAVFLKYHTMCRGFLILTFQTRYFKLDSISFFGQQETRLDEEKQDLNTGQYVSLSLYKTRMHR